MKGNKALSTRANWQAEANKTGLTGEKLVGVQLHNALPSHYNIERRPKKLVMDTGNKGIVLDLKVTNQKTNKTIFLEVKTGERGGNATEERAAKFLSSGIRRRIKRLVPNAADHPVLSVFQGSIFEGNKPFKIYDKKGKATNIDPVTYREKVDVIFEGHPYAIISSQRDSYADLARKIQDALE